MFGGRSNFGNFFLGSGRGREAGETRALHESVSRRFAGSPFAAEGWASQFAIDIVADAVKRADGIPLAPLMEALITFVEELIEQDGLMLPPPSGEALESLSLEEGVNLRRSLRRRDRFLADVERLLPQWRNPAYWITAGVLRSLPPSVIVESVEEAQALGDKGPLSAPLIDLCEDPGVLIERAIYTLYEDPLFEGGLFEPLRERLTHNLRVTSGVNPDRPEASGKPLIFPSQAKNKSPMELVRAYCVGTPFERLLQTQVPFAIPFPARFEHTHIVGGSGHGKTQLMQSMIYDDLLHAKEDRRSIIVIDSQGDLINTIAHLRCFAPGEEGDLGDRLVIVDPADIEYPVCLNLFDWGGKRAAANNPVEREKLLNSAIALYEYIFGALLGAELTQKQGVIFKYLARLMLEIPEATIHTLAQLMEDGERFRPHMERLTGSARQFFATRFFDRSFNETKKQILTRLWGVLSNGTLERIFGSSRNKVDLFDAMNSGKIVLINTAKDVLTHDGSALLGRFFIALIAQAAVQRASIAPHERRPCFVYIDEAADYFDDAVEHLLNQARKYKVGLILAHQNLDQLSTGLRASLMASTSIKFAGGVSAKDARAFADEMRCEPDLLQSMRKRRTETEFGCFVRQFTPQALSVTVPLAFVESQPRLLQEDYDDLIATNRLLYCVPFEEALPPKPLSETTREPPAAKDTAGPESVPAPSDRPVPPKIPEPTVSPSAGHLQTAKVAEAPRKGPPAEKEVSNVPPLMGRGGKQHKYLQHLIKQIAEEQGWRAVIEESTPDGDGRIDVALSRGERRIACEISVTSTRDQELANVQKCLSIGYKEVMLVAGTERQRQMLEKYVAGALDENEQAKVRYVIAEELLAYLQSQEPPTEQTIRGYRVRVTHQQVDAAEADAKRKAVAAVIARSLRRVAE